MKTQKPTHMVQSTLDEKRKAEIVTEVDEESKLSPLKQATTLFEQMDVVNELI